MKCPNCGSIINFQTERRIDGDTKCLGCGHSGPTKSFIVKKPEEKKATDVQEGGQHYKNMKYQPVVFAHNVSLSFLEGNVVKYITRYEFKNGLEDLKKVKHYIELMLQLVYGESPSDYNAHTTMIQLDDVLKHTRHEYNLFVLQNNLRQWESTIIWLVISSSMKNGVNQLNEAWKLTVDLIKDKYGVDV